MTVEKTLEQKGLEIPRETKTPQISRRAFLKGLSALLGVAGASMVGLSLKEYLSAQAQASEELESLETTDEILAFIKEEYGVEVPNKISKEYSEKIYIRTSQEELKLHELIPNALLTSEEAKILAETISLTPGVGYLVQLIIPFRYNAEGGIPGGGYLGYQWPAFLRSGDYTAFPYDRFISEKTAIRLEVPGGVKMTSPLPEYSNTRLSLFLQSSFYEAGIEAKTYMEVPWTTHGERLRQVIAHETGHSLLDQILLADSKDMEEYWQRQTFTVFNKNTWDIENPLLVAFAQVNGWKLVPYVNFVRQYDPDYADKLPEEKPQYKDKVIWDRDIEVWGDLASRRIRLTPYASYGPIQEAFSEYWMASILYSELLTPEEKEFFQKIHEGLEKNPETLIQTIVSSP